MGHPSLGGTRDVEHDILINGLIPGPTNTGIWGRDKPKLQPARDSRFGSEVAARERVLSE